MKPTTHAWSKIHPKAEQLAKRVGRMMLLFLGGFVLSGVVGAVAAPWIPTLGWAAVGLGVGGVIGGWLAVQGTAFVAWTAHVGCAVRGIEALWGREVAENVVWQIVHDDVARAYGSCPTPDVRRWITRGIICGCLDESIHLLDMGEAAAALARECLAPTTGEPPGVA